MEKKRIMVVAALITREDSDGERRFLICRRPPHKARGLLWEFVGGKIEPGETGREALRRECREELDIEVAVGEERAAFTYEYPDLTVDLTLYAAEITRGAPKMLEHCGILWITPGEIPRYSFCPADEKLLAMLKNGI